MLSTLFFSLWLSLKKSQFILCFAVGTCHQWNPSTSQGIFRFFLIFFLWILSIFFTSTAMQTLRFTIAHAHSSFFFLSPLNSIFNYFSA
uniref:Uncharacterized protein n=1 Tax=Panagrolaimus sp. PS1159 TaxID=55785 RepID=A0AC35FQ78_9BILA